MKVVYQLKSVRWTPKHHYRPGDCVRLFAEGIELSNSVADADWNSDPVWPMVCEECWENECGSYRIASVARTDCTLLWMTPPVDLVFRERRVPSAQWTEIYRSNCIKESFLIDGESWNGIADEHPSLPRFESFRQITNIDLYYLWLQTLPEFLVKQHPMSLVPDAQTPISRIKRHCVAGDPYDWQDIQSELLVRLENPPEQVQPLTGSFAQLEEIEAPVQSLYFNFPGFPEWKSFLANKTQELIFENRWCFRSSSS